MKHVIVFLALFFSFQSWGQSVDSAVNKLGRFMYALDNFSKQIPHEKVYLHFDNTSYYQGDNIWFKCYVVNSGPHQPSRWSKTLYVELLNPGGEMVDKRILKIENGQCHGDFSLTQVPFYSGFYEIRAYTKYMLNFGDDAIFSRLLPVFDKPKEEGNFEEKEMTRYGIGNYPMKRGKPDKEKRVNLRFFPEGGNLVQGVASRLAFEATNATGNPIDITGVVVDGSKQELYQFSTLHEGRGVLTYTPDAGKRKAIVEYSGRKYQFDLPTCSPQGIVMETDNLSCPDSIRISLRKNEHTPAGIFGMAVLNGGRMQNHFFINMADDKELRFNIHKAKLLSGVSRIVLFGGNGEILCDRLVFTNRGKTLNINAKTGKPAYKPHELVDMEFSIMDKDENPIRTMFSVAVKDRMNEVESKHNILTDLLLMSEIKGYVSDPSWYFEEDDDTRHAALDLLLMIQGWRRYSWEQMAGITPFELKYFPEQGIEIHGQVVSFVRSVPKPDVDVSFFLVKRGEEDEKGASLFESFVTDSLGRFSFAADIQGKWNMILSVMEKGKKKDHRILLDRLFSPEPKKYRYAEMQVTVVGEDDEEMNDEETSDLLEEDLASFFKAYEDSLAKAGISEKVHQLEEVTVTAKKRSRERDIFSNRSTSVAYYDVLSELDDIKDKGKFVGNDMHEMLVNMNNNFTISRRGADEYVLYKYKLPLFVINYERTEHTEMGYNRYKQIRLEAIKSIYINETLSVKCKYADIRMSPMDVDDIYSCAVLIETYPEGEIPAEAGKGVRKTWLEGYSTVREFYSPNYSAMPPEPDYRRTLYWNPSITSGEDGKANIQFYNNSKCRTFSISAETITPQGVIGVYRDK